MFLSRKPPFDPREALEKSGKGESSGECTGRGRVSIDRHAPAPREAFVSAHLEPSPEAAKMALHNDASSIHLHRLLSCTGSSEQFGLDDGAVPIQRQACVPGIDYHSQVDLHRPAGGRVPNSDAEPYGCIALAGMTHAMPPGAD